MVSIHQPPPRSIESGAGFRHNMRELEGLMEHQRQVAHYAASLTKELCRMCRQVRLDDLAYLLEIAASEANKARATNAVAPPIFALEGAEA